MENMPTTTLALLFLIAATSTPEISASNHNDTIKMYYPILKDNGASEEESIALLAIALYETNGYLNSNVYCKVGGCDGGIARGAWQIHCIDKPGSHWKFNRWKWWLIAKRPDVFTKDFSCRELNTDYSKSTLAAIIVYRAYAATNSDPATIALLWHGLERSKAIVDRRRNSIKRLLAYVRLAVEKKT